MAMRRKVLAASAAALAVGGAGAAIAATHLNDPSPQAESKAIVDAAARNLGIEPGKLAAAIRKAMIDRVDAAVAAGRITKAEGEELKQRIRSGEFPLFGPPALGHDFAPPHPFFHGLGAAESYLGLSEAQLRDRLDNGKTLAQIAKAQGKSVEGLESALLDDAKAKLDAAVEAGRLTKADEQRVLADLKSRIDDFVNLKLGLRIPRPMGRGFDRDFHRDGPPAFHLPGSAA